MQKAYENQFVNSANGMLFACVKHKECIRSAGMLNTIAASKDAFSF
jgi:hypothetical protein